MPVFEEWMRAFGRTPEQAKRVIDAMYARTGTRVLTHIAFVDGVWQYFERPPETAAEINQVRHDQAVATEEVRGAVRQP